MDTNERSNMGGNMRLQNKKDPDIWIKVLAKRNKIILNRHGKVMLKNSNHDNLSTITAEVLWAEYLVPEGVTLKE